MRRLSLLVARVRHRLNKRLPSTVMQQISTRRSGRCWNQCSMARTLRHSWTRSCRMQMMLTSLCTLQTQTIQSSMQACASPLAVKPSGRQPPDMNVSLPPVMNVSLVKMCPTASSRQVEQAPQVARMQPVCSHAAWPAFDSHVHDELAAAQPRVQPYSFDEARQLMLSHHAQRTLRALAALPAEETKKPWQSPCHSFRHNVMACSPTPVAFDMRQYMPQLTPVTGAEAALEWRNERIRYWQSLKTPKTVARHEKLAEAVEQAASRGPSKQSAGHHMVALARDKVKFNLLHQRQRLRRGSPWRLPQLRGWMPFGLMRHRGLKRPVLPSSTAAQPISAQAIAPAHQCSPIPVLSGRCDNALCIQALCVPSSCAFDDAFWVLSRPQ